MELTSKINSESGDYTLYQNIGSYKSDKDKEIKLYSLDCKSTVIVEKDSRDNNEQIVYWENQKEAEPKVYTPKDDYKIVDVIWSYKDGHLFILEKKSRVKRTLGSLFRAIFGHGDIVSSYRLTRIDQQTNSFSSNMILENYSSAIAAFKGPYGTCEGNSQRITEKN